MANGFRNIQNLVQKMKRKRCTYDFVEVMACPSGCLNGGAQARQEEETAAAVSSAAAKAALENLVALHRYLEVQNQIQINASLNQGPQESRQDHFRRAQGGAAKPSKEKSTVLVSRGGEIVSQLAMLNRAADSALAVLHARGPGHPGGC